MQPVLSVKLEAFEGPLDLLLHLIDKNKVNIYDIPIAEITDQYMEYVRADGQGGSGCSQRLSGDGGNASGYQSRGCFFLQRLTRREKKRIPRAGAGGTAPGI